MKTMIDYMQEVPSLCNKQIQNKDKLVRDFVDLYCLKEYRRIILIASGSSYNIANTIRYYLQKILHVEVKVIWPITFVEDDHDFLEGSLIVCMSQSGKSTNTILAAKKAKACGCDVCAVTTDVNAPIKNACDYVFSYGIDSSDYYVAKGFPTSIVFFSLFAIEAAKQSNQINEQEYQSQLKDLQKVVHSMGDNLVTAKSFYEANKNDLGSMQRAMFVGLGSGYGVALEGALKINEMFGIPANAYEMDEFLHGPCYEITKDHAIFLIDHNSATKRRMASIYEGLHLLSDRVYLISNHDNVSLSNRKILTIETSENCNFIALLDTIIFQMIADSLCLEYKMIAYTIRNHRFEQMVNTKTNL